MTKDYIAREAIEYKKYIGKENFIAGWNADLVNHSIIFAIPWFTYINMIFVALLSG